jgi:hypothetical protein
MRIFPGAFSIQWEANMAEIPRRVGVALYRIVTKKNASLRDQLKLMELLLKKTK